MHKTSTPTLIGGMMTQLSETQTNYRPQMEDFSFANEITLQKMNPTYNQISIYGVCDGHAGYQVAKYLSENMKTIIADGLSELSEATHLLDHTLMTKILCNCFAILEANLEKDLHGTTAGSTCAMVLCSRPLNTFYAVNCGDSSVLGIRYDANSKATKISRITRLHKPNDPDETIRIKAAGGFIVFIAGTARLCASLAVSRSFGDLDHRDYGMTEQPDVLGPLKLASSCDTCRNDDFIGFLITSDGITDFQPNDSMQSLLAENFDHKNEFADLLIKKTPSMDNASAISAFIG